MLSSIHTHARARASEWVTYWKLRNIKTISKWQHKVVCFGLIFRLTTCVSHKTTLLSLFRRYLFLWSSRHISVTARIFILNSVCNTLLAMNLCHPNCPPVKHAFDGRTFMGRRQTCFCQTIFITRMTGLQEEVYIFRLLLLTDNYWFVYGISRNISVLCRSDLE